MLNKCSSYVSATVRKHHYQKQPGEERRYLAYTSLSLPITEGNNSRTKAGQAPGGQN